MSLGKNPVSRYHLNYFVDYHQIIGDRSDIPTSPSLEEEKLIIILIQHDLVNFGGQQDDSNKTHLA